jgi:hypothetical protein
MSIEFNEIILLIVQIVITSLLSWNTSTNILKRMDLAKITNIEFKKKLKQIKNSNTITGRLMRSRRGSGVSSNLEKNPMTMFDITTKIFGSPTALLLYSFLTILITTYFFSNGGFLAFGISIVFTFYILTLTAVSYGFSQSYLPPAKIIMDDGKVIEGRVIKFDEYFIYMLRGNEKIFINSSKVKIIRESKFKEGTKNYK